MTGDDHGDGRGRRVGEGVCRALRVLGELGNLAAFGPPSKVTRSAKHCSEEDCSSLFVFVVVIGEKLVNNDINADCFSVIFQG